MTLWSVDDLVLQSHDWSKISVWSIENNTILFTVLHNWYSRDLLWTPISNFQELNSWSNISLISILSVQFFILPGLNMLVVFYWKFLSGQVSYSTSCWLIILTNSVCLACIIRKKVFHKRVNRNDVYFHWVTTLVLY